MKSSLLRDLSRHYELSASVLVQNRQWSASYHLAGLSVEFALKACIAKTFARNAIPDKRLVQQVYTHEPARLVVLAGLEPDRLAACGRSTTFARFWTIVSEWDADSRYQRWSMSEAKSMLDAVAKPTDGMDKVALVERDLEEAAKLVDLLIERGLPVQMAAWVRRELDAPFKLLIASPNIQKFGPLVGYDLLVEALQTSKIALGLDSIRLTNTTGMPPGPDQSFSYVFPVSGLQDEVFVFQSQARVHASAIPPSADAA